MTRLRTLTLAGLAAVLLALGALAGSIVTTANAQIPPGCVPFGAGGITCPARPVVTPAPSPAPAATPEAVRGEGTEGYECSIVEGCSLILLDEDGQPFRTMHVTFTDVEAEPEVSEE